MMRVFLVIGEVANTPHLWIFDRRRLITPSPDREIRLYNLKDPVSSVKSLTTTAGRKVRSTREFLRGLFDTAHPLLVQIIPIRRCNIDCGYCNEYDKVSDPVPRSVLERRIDKLHELGRSVVAFSGGEPMLHPVLDDLDRKSTCLNS